MIGRFAFRMLMKTYCGYILLVDAAQFIFFTFYSIFLAFYHTFCPPNEKSIRNKIAAVVGASRGVGRDIAIQLAIQHGATVICIDIDSVGNASTVNNINLSGGKAHAYTCDVTNEEQVHKVISKIELDVGAIQLIFHCCGIPSPRSYTTNPRPLKTSLDISVVSHFYLLDAILPGFKARKNGHIVILTSVAGLCGMDRQLPLGVSQFAVQGLFESLVENLRIEDLSDFINVSLVHLYPFIVSEEYAKDISMRIPNFFGTITAKLAAKLIVEGVLRNESDISIPRHVLYIGHLVRLLPRKAVTMLRTFLDTGVDF